MPQRGTKGRPGGPRCNTSGMGGAADLSRPDAGAGAARPAPAGARPLRVWEQVGAGMTISYGFELDGFLHADTLRAAWAAVQRRFPYACTAVHTVPGGAAAFVHDPQAPARPRPAPCPRPAQSQARRHPWQL